MYLIINNKNRKGSTNCSIFFNFTTRAILYVYFHLLYFNEGRIYEKSGSFSHTAIRRGIEKKNVRQYRLYLQASYTCPIYTYTLKEIDPDGVSFSLGPSITVSPPKCTVLEIRRELSERTFKGYFLVFIEEKP